MVVPWRRQHQRGYLCHPLSQCARENYVDNDHSEDDYKLHNNGADRSPRGNSQMTTRLSHGDDSIDAAICVIPYLNVMLIEYETQMGWLTPTSAAQ